MEIVPAQAYGVTITWTLVGEIFIVSDSGIVRWKRFEVTHEN